MKISPSVDRLNQQLVQDFPNQQQFLNKRFSNLDESEIVHLECVASLISRLIEGREAEFVADYVWWCGQQLEEELFFRRNGNRYRYTTFIQCLNKIYSDEIFMSRYMNALLLTQLWWSNHSQSLGFYINTFLNEAFKKFDGAGSHLEIGPGHGLLSYLLSNKMHSAKFEAWDVSSASLEATRASLRKLGGTNEPKLVLSDLFNVESQNCFDSVVLSEVLEHLENPKGALKKIRELLKPEGLFFLNMPINSPAPDHLFNLENPEDLSDLVVEMGFQVVDSKFFPATNQTLEKCRKRKLTISCNYLLSIA